jgi:hypothetical protein
MRDAGTAAAQDLAVRIAQGIEMDFWKLCPHGAANKIHYDGSESLQCGTAVLTISCAVMARYVADFMQTTQPLLNWNTQLPKGL